MNAENPRAKVCMLANSGHKPFDTRIFHKEALTLLSAGHDVTIIIPTLKDEVTNGVKIIGVPLHQKGWKKLILCPWYVFRQALRQPKDAVFHLHDSELLMIGIWLKLLGRKVVYDAHEDTPLQIDYQHWLPRGVKTMYKWFYILIEKISGWLFDGIIVAEPVIAKYFPKKKTALIRNFPIVKQFDERFVPYDQRKKTLIYVGLLSNARGAIQMAKAATRAKQKCDFEFQLGGSFSPAELEKEVLKYPVHFLGWLSFDKMVDSMMRARAGIIIPQPIERYKTNYPVKLFEYMAAGLPVIATKFGEVAEFVKEAGCGITVDPENETEIAEAIQFVFSNEAEAQAMGARGRALVASKYSWETESESLIKFYDKFKAIKS